MSDTVERETRSLMEGVDPEGALGTYLAWVRTAILPAFAARDEAANALAARHRFTIRYIYLTAAAVVALVATQALFLPALTPLIWGEVLLILSMIAVQRAGASRGVHPRWLEERYLAERLRCAVFTFLFRGRKDEHGAGPQRSFLASGERSIAWAAVVDALPTEDRPAWDPATNLDAVKELLVRGWVESQRRYHERAAARSHAALERIERVGLGFLVATLFAAVLHALGVGHHTPLVRFWEAVVGGGHGDGGHPTAWTVGNLLTILAIVLPAISASMNAIKHALEMHKVGLRSERVAAGLVPFSDRLRAATDATALAAVVDELEGYFLREHEEWFSLVSHKTADVG